MDRYHHHVPNPDQLPRAVHVHAHRDNDVEGHVHPGLQTAGYEPATIRIATPKGKLPPIHRRRPAETIAAGFAIPAGALEAALRHDWLAAGLLFAAGVLPAVVSRIKDHGIRGLVTVVWKGGG